jgi:hypothetical protein
MDLSTFVGKLLEEQDGDVLREGSGYRSAPMTPRQALVGVSATSGPKTARVTGTAAAADLGHAVGFIDRDSEGADGDVFPACSGAGRSRPC